MRRTFLIGRLFSLVAIALAGGTKASYAQAKKAEPSPPTAFYWVVDNDNRVFKSNGEQHKYLSELCRSRYCAIYGAKQDVVPAQKSLEAYCSPDMFPHSCNGFSRTKAVTISGAEMKLWSPIPQAVDTNWNANEARYREGYATEMRRLVKAFLPAPGQERQLPDIKQRPDVRCNWTLKGGGKEQQSGQTSCAQTVGFEILVDESYVLSLSVTSIAGAALPAPYDAPVSRVVKVRDIVLLVLGDSYTSGEGNPHWFADFPATHHQTDLDAWWDRRCHRSLMSYPVIASAIASVQARYPVGDEKYTFTLLDYACSGSEIGKEGAGKPDLTSGGVLSEYEGRETAAQIKHLERNNRVMLEAVRSEGIPAQVEAAQRDLCLTPIKLGQTCPNLRPADYIVTSIGGNDVGFGPVLKELIAGCETETAKASKCPKDLLKKRFENLGNDQGTGGAFEKLVDRLQVFRHRPDNVHKRKTPILLVEYPDVTSASKDGAVCDDDNFARILAPENIGSVKTGILASVFGEMSLDNGLVVYWQGRRIRVSSKDAKWAQKEVLGHLNGMLRSIDKNSTFKARGVELLGGIEKMSRGRGWCKIPSWFITFEESAAKVGSLVDKDGKRDPQMTTGIAHPNFFGHNFIAWRLRCRLSEDNIIKPDNIFDKDIGKCQELENVAQQ